MDVSASTTRPPRDRCGGIVSGYCDPLIDVQPIEVRSGAQRSIEMMCASCREVAGRLGLIERRIEDRRVSK